MKNKVFYSVKEYSLDGELLIKEGLEVRVTKDTGSSIEFSTKRSGGRLSYDIFHSIFTPFRVNEVVYHKFYGIGQIALSHKEGVNLSVYFFSHPHQAYEIDESEIKIKDLTR